MTREWVDKQGAAVLSFARALRNASRVGAYVDTVVEMFNSGAWKSYKTAVGNDEWRSHEFDYFLISCDAAYSDVFKILTWKSVQASKMAEHMMSDSPRVRRSLEDASAAWNAPTRETLIDLARRNGWLRHGENGDGAALKLPPVGHRALARARFGKTEDALRSQKLVRAVQTRRPALDRLIERIAKELADDEREIRYVALQLRKRVKEGRPFDAGRERWTRDVRELNGDATKLGERWGVTYRTAQKRAQRLSET